MPTGAATEMADAARSPAHIGFQALTLSSCALAIVVVRPQCEQANQAFKVILGMEPFLFTRHDGFPVNSSHLTAEWCQSLAVANP